MLQLAVATTTATIPHTTLPDYCVMSSRGWRWHRWKATGWNRSLSTKRITVDEYFFTEALVVHPLCPATPHGGYTRSWKAYAMEWQKCDAFEGMSKPEDDLTTEQHRNGRVGIVLVAKGYAFCTFMVLSPSISSSYLSYVIYIQPVIFFALPPPPLQLTAYCHQCQK